MTDAPGLMSRDEVAALWGIDPEAVRSTLRRYGISERRGYLREAVEAVERPGKGHRTDLDKKRAEQPTNPDPTTKED